MSHDVTNPAADIKARGVVSTPEQLAYLDHHIRNGLQAMMFDSTIGQKRILDTLDAIRDGIADA